MLSPISHRKVSSMIFYEVVDKHFKNAKKERANSPLNYGLICIDCKCMGTCGSGPTYGILLLCCTIELDGESLARNNFIE